MILALSSNLLENDYIFFEFAGNKRFVLYSIDESFSLDGSSFDIKCCNLYVEITENNQTVEHKCTNIIGLEDEHIRVFSNNPELLSSRVTIDNINEVLVELYE